MSRYCKDKLDIGVPTPERILAGLKYPPPHSDYDRHKEFTTPRVFDPLEHFKEDELADLKSEVSDVGEDEPVELGNQMWLDICKEHRTKNEKALKIYEEIKRREDRRHCEDTAEVDYLRKNLFPILMRALEATLHKATGLQLLRRERTGYDPVDTMSELMWNTNPKFPQRAKDYRRIFEIEHFADWLRKHPRPGFPRHFFWTRAQCALCIQRNFRGYLVRRRPDVQQVREFWKVLKGQKSAPENDPELTFGEDISNYKQKYPDLLKSDEKQKLKKLSVENLK
ncbi:Hypothetical protein motif containing K [Nesidiocoris tenuis]|uniref:Uncharacterized protein n=1 Tax=Nesidiocoris tenuis TaxID=355587 RepID=A0ABN7ABP4_9HEMI|nr:Hypothetical protein motif containing K [Nesidiocoris tenuis]